MVWKPLTRDSSIALNRRHGKRLIMISWHLENTTDQLAKA